MANLEEVVREARAKLGIDGREDAEFNALSPSERSFLIGAELRMMDEALAEQDAEALRNVRALLDAGLREAYRIIIAATALIRGAK